MKSLTMRSLWWLTGPTVGLLLIACVGWVGPGPGLFLWAALAGIMFFIGTPLLQLALIRSPKLKGRYAAACIGALATVTCCAAIAWVSGAFDFWRAGPLTAN